MSTTIFDSPYEICLAMRKTAEQHERHPDDHASVQRAMAAFESTDSDLPMSERWERAGNIVAAPTALPPGYEYASPPADPAS